MAELHKMSKNYRKAFDSVVQGSFSNESLSVLLDYLNFLDQVKFSTESLLNVIFVVDVFFKRFENIR
jgi:hypothetical protein